MRWCIGASQNRWDIGASQYSITSNPFPTNLLRSGFISGYHCFINAYIRAKVEGFDPLKLPDGTVF